MHAFTFKYSFRSKVTKKLSSQGDNEGPVHLPVGVPDENVWEAALQHVLAQERRLLHNLDESA